MIVSYQAEGTLGRQISEGVERIQIFDQWYDLNAAVYVLDGFSGHADRNDLAWWFEQTGGNIEHAFLVHGEPESMDRSLPCSSPTSRAPSSYPNCTPATRSDENRGLSKVMKSARPEVPRPARRRTGRSP